MERGSSRDKGTGGGLGIFLGLVAFSLAGSLMSRLTHLDPGPIAPVASLLTLGAGVWATFAEYVRVVPRAWMRLSGALVLGAGSEVVGLATGFPFGRYVYTGAWWPTVGLPFGHFPLALPFAWLLMAGAARLCWGGFSQRRKGAKGKFVGIRRGCSEETQRHEARTKTPLAGAVAGGLLAAAVDLAMEPAMAGRLGYWRWLAPGPLPGGAPWANFFGWWGVAALAGVALAWGGPSVDARGPRWVLGGFVALVLGLGLIR